MNPNGEGCVWSKTLATVAKSKGRGAKFEGR